jgi:hypothetical protein
MNKPPRKNDMSDKDTPRVDPSLAAGNSRPAAGYPARHFLWKVDGVVGRIEAFAAKQKPRFEGN